MPIRFIEQNVFLFVVVFNWKFGVRVEVGKALLLNCERSSVAHENGNNLVSDFARIGRWRNP